MADFGLLILRLTVGTLLAGHGSQKLFGWFSGPGLKGTHGFMEKLGMKPGKVWGTLAALSEFGGGVLTALGLLNPLGPLNIAGAMTVAVRRAHWNKPIWASSGGAELPLTNLAVASALTLAGPGRYSLDNLLGIRIPRWLSALALVSTVGTAWAAVRRPEIAQVVLEKATSMVPGTPATSPAGPDLEVETRQRSGETETPEIKREVGI